MIESLVAPAEIPVQEYIDDPQVGLGEMLTRMGLEGLTPEERLVMVETATLDDYKSAADALHRKVAPDHSHDEHPDAVKIIDPKTGAVRHYTAAPAERDGILSKALESAKLVVAKYRSEGGNIEDALQRCGNLAAFGIVLAHRYENGNGRTARTMGELIHNGYDSSSQESVQDLAVVSANRPDKGFRINSYVPKGEWADSANTRPLEFLDLVAALDQPLDGHSYAVAASGTFTTPRM